MQPLTRLPAPSPLSVPQNGNLPMLKTPFTGSKKYKCVRLATVQLPALFPVLLPANTDWPGRLC